MFANLSAMATVAVRDLPAARKFYEGILGLEPSSESAAAVTYRSGTSQVLLYASEFAGTNRATSVTWSVGNRMDAIVRRLDEAGVPFEHYDLPGLVREGHLHVADGFEAAWFTDPDGNILHINNG